MTSLRPGPLAMLACWAALGAGALAPATHAAESASPVNDQGSSVHYRSLITAVSPATPGLSVQVLQFADRLQLTNHTGSTVTVYGYQGEPYLRVLANGTVEQNTRSPATYLNQSFFGDINVPAPANAKAAPAWRVLDRTGGVEWHDHRIHYTSPAVPPQVKDQGRRTLVFDWNVPITVGASHGAISGALYWVPNSSKAPLGAIVAGLVIVLAGALAVVLTRGRRRRGPPAAAGTGPGEGEPAREAW